MGSQRRILLEGGGGQPLEGGQDTKRGSLFGDWDGAAVFSAMPWQAEQAVVMMTDGSSISLAVAGTPVEPKPECWRSWLNRVEIEMDMPRVASS